MLVTLPAYYEPLRAEVDGWLNDYQASLERQSEIPKRLLEAIRYTLLAPGKRVRPILTLLSCEACGGGYRLALPAAAAVEMIHTYSLIHDDLPAMDDDDLRRGRPTCHKAFDEATAILAGDALLTLAFDVLAEQIAVSGQAARCIRVLSRAAGIHGMVGGQMDDILQEGQPSGTIGQLKSIHERKTGALLSAAVSMGTAFAFFARTPDARHDAVHQYAIELGLAFQIADDLLDVQSNSATLGKATQKDANHGKLTYPGLLGIEGAQRELKQAQERGLAALEPLGTSGSKLAELLIYVVERDR